MKTTEEKWFYESLPWLRKWLSCFRKGRFTKGGQWFKRKYELRYGSVHGSLVGATKQIVSDLNSEFEPMVLYVLVFGAKSTKTTPRTISGFLQKYGRLPTRKDRVEIVANVFGRPSFPNVQEEWYGESFSHSWHIERIQIANSDSPK